MAMVHGGELVVRTLVQEGVESVYLLYGGHLQPICESIRAHGLNYVYMRHEVTAGYAAQGYARASGDFGVAMVSAAPGFTNVLSSVTNAFIDRTPVVYISTSAAQRDAETNNFMSGFDPIAMVRPVTKWAHCATSTKDIPRLLAHAIRVATTAPTGPVLLDLPWDVVFGKVEEAEATVPRTVRTRTSFPPAPEAVDEALRLLATAKRPVIMAGEAANHPSVSAELRAFVKNTGIPVFSSYDGIGALPADDPAYAGTLLKMVALRRTPEPPDVVLALGVRFGFMTVGPTGCVPPDAKVIHVDFDPKEIGRTRDVEVGIAASATETLRALNAGHNSQSWPNWSGWRDRLQADKKARLETETAAVAGRSDPIPPFQAAQALVEAAGDEAIFVVDGADAHMWIAEAAQNRPRAKPGAFFAHSSFFGCLGYGVGFAIGVQNVHPKERVVCVMGDGAMGLTLAELHTLALHDLPVIVVVMNNNAWGATSHYQDTTTFGTQGQYFAMDLSGAHYHDVAKALGCYGALVTEIDQLKPAVDAAIASGKPACINVVIDLEDVAPDHKALTFLSH